MKKGENFGDMGGFLGKRRKSRPVSNWTASWRCVRSEVKCRFQQMSRDWANKKWSCNLGCQVESYSSKCKSPHCCQTFVWISEWKYFGSSKKVRFTAGLLCALCVLLCVLSTEYRTLHKGDCWLKVLIPHLGQSYYFCRQQRKKWKKKPKTWTVYVYVSKSVIEDK